MRILLFILAVLAAGICIEKPAAAQSGGWCAYLNGGGNDGGRFCGFATLQQCLAEVRGVGGNCSPVRIMSRHASGIDGAILIERSGSLPMLADRLMLFVALIGRGRLWR